MSYLVYNRYRIELRKHLRKESTEFEKLLWQKLRNKQLGSVCRRQVSIGKYVVDFCFLQQKLVIELDGVQHEAQEEYDLERTRFLESQGFRVLRFWNSDIIQSEKAVLDRIYTELHHMS